MASPLGAPPPGNEAKTLKEIQVQEDLLGFLKNDCNPDLSRFKGAAFVYKFSNTGTDSRVISEQLKAANLFLRGSSITKMPEFRYPHSTRRIFGVIPTLIDMFRM